jgi:NAD(P)-dependent dehydrogenase (short-subunit alcohol dehydrogenase family)
MKEGPRKKEEGAQKMRLENRSVIVTGAGRGLGRAISLDMAREGARLTMLSRTLKELDRVADQIKSEGGACQTVEADVSDPGAVQKAVNACLDRFKGIDVLVNNAGVIGPSRFLEDADAATWDRTLGINLSGAFYFAKEVVPVMIEKGKGKIINISSGLGQMAFPRFCAYGVSKAGIIQLTRSLAEELKGFHIRVNAIDPGVMDTPMQERIREMGPSVLGEEIYDHFMAYKEHGHLKDPHKVASLAVYLASTESDHLSGNYGTLTDYAKLGYRD